MFEEILSFISKYYFLPIYVVTLIISISRYREYFDTVLKYLPIIIAYTFFNELLGTLIREYPSFSFFNELNYSSHNHILYNIYMVVFYTFFLRVYESLLKKRRNKLFANIALLTFLLAIAVSFFFQNPMDIEFFYAIALGSFLLVAIIVLYFIEKFEENKNILQWKNLVFWISISLLIFNSIFPVIYLIGYLDLETWEKLNLRLVLNLIIIIMYSLMIIGFIKSRRRAFG